MTAFVMASICFTPATAHNISWPKGSSHLEGFGDCAKGPCQQRDSFDAFVPHLHVSFGKCEGLGADGYTFGNHYNCSTGPQFKLDKVQ